jgi:SpoU rRNA Methylase family
VVQDVDWTRPSAVIFGNEAQGVTQAALEAADQSVIIPMRGFADSFNISVAASLLLYEAQQQRIREQGHHANLSQQQQEVLAAVMMLRDQVSFRVSLVNRATAYPLHMSLSVVQTAAGTSNSTGGGAHAVDVSSCKKQQKLCVLVNAAKFCICTQCCNLILPQHCHFTHTLCRSWVQRTYRSSYGSRRHTGSRGDSRG